MEKNLFLGLGFTLATAIGAFAQPAAAPAAAPGTNGLGPRIQFATRDANFGRVQNGELVKYTYYFTNTGDAELHVSNVAPGCGCTHAGDWTRVVAPGATGVIPIQLNTANQPHDVTKFVTVNCDDKTVPNGSLQLILRGITWRLLDVTPQYVNFSVPPDAPGASTSVTITNNGEEPVFFSPPQSSSPGFAVELKTNTEGRSYQLVISRIPPLSPGSQQTTITTKPSLTNAAPLQIYAWANVQPALTILPLQLALPQAPLTNPSPYTITIQNHTTNHMVLTDPTVTAPDVKVELREVQPGRYIDALLTFPAGFTVQRGEKVKFSVKSSLPNNPLIEVPILQVGPPAQPAPGVPGQPTAAPRVLPLPPQPRADAR